MKHSIERLAGLVIALSPFTAMALEVTDYKQDPSVKIKESKQSFVSRLSVGGYGEAVMSRNFYSDNYLRYTHPDSYRNESHGRFDIPHVCIWLGYDFGKGWSMGSEIEFEHGGSESAVEIETEEGGEYEKEIERGGEVALEQFWIQKEFMPQLILRAGMQVVPVGGTNAHHEPDNFFSVYRPEGDNSIIPCTWHETAITLKGRAGKWSYQAMFLPGLDSERFGNQSWIHDGSASPFEFKIANNYACAARIENYSVPNLRLAVSGYVGNSFRNTLYSTSNSRNNGVRGTISLASFDFSFKNTHVIARGSFLWGHLSDARHIGRFNMGMPKTSTSKRQEVASQAISAWAEVGYNFFSLSRRLSSAYQKLYLFGRYDYYNPMLKMDNGQKPLKWTERNVMTAGINYFPLKQIVIKGEYSLRMFRHPYNNEPSINLGIAYVGWFL